MEIDPLCSPSYASDDRSLKEGTGISGAFAVLFPVLFCTLVTVLNRLIVERIHEAAKDNEDVGSCLMRVEIPW